VKTDEIVDLLRIYGDATYFLERLIKSLRKKRKDGDWDRSMGVREQPAEYVAGATPTEVDLPEDMNL